MNNPKASKDSSHTNSQKKQKIEKTNHQLEQPKDDSKETNKLPTSSEDFFKKWAEEPPIHNLTEDEIEKILEEIDEEYRNDTSPMFSTELEEAIEKEGFTKENLRRMREEAKARAARREQKS